MTKYLSMFRIFSNSSFTVFRQIVIFLPLNKVKSLYTYSYHCDLQVSNPYPELYLVLVLIFACDLSWRICGVPFTNCSVKTFVSRHQINLFLQLLYICKNKTPLSILVIITAQSSVKPLNTSRIIH